MMFKNPSKSLGSLSLFVLSGVCTVAACSSGSDSHGAPVSVGGTSGDGSGASGGRSLPTGASGGSGGAGAANGAEAGQAGDGSSEGGLLGEAGLPQGVVVVVPPAACSETAVWMSATPLSAVSTAAAETLLSITSDELDIVFLRAGAVFRAHRDAASGTFDAGTAVTLPDGYVATAGAALSGDALTLVLVSTDGQAFASLSRASRTADFGASADATAFVALNERSAQTLEHYAAPVLAADGSAFVFTGFTPGAGGLSVVYESALAAGEWAMPNNISNSVFDGTGTARKLPTGLSSDLRTLFYFDEGTNTETAIFRDRPDAPLYDMVPLGQLAGAAPNSACNRLYYSSSGDVLTETD